VSADLISPDCLETRLLPEDSSFILSFSPWRINVTAFLFKYISLVE
jgi:hypothetical protein